MIKIDGSLGEGGGQILRTSLSLSMITGIPFVMENIRVKRNNPGLQRQHLTSVLAAKEISGSQVTGDHTGSLSLTFKPGKIKSGKYHFKVGTAGSASLIFQTVLPALLFENKESFVTIEGGTHNPFAPPYEFIEKSFLRILNRIGYSVSSSIRSYGFYPAGGGKVSATIAPYDKLEKLELIKRGELVNKKACALSANLPDVVNIKEIELLKKRLKWDDKEFEVRNVSSPGPGNVIMIELDHEYITEIFTGFGEKRLPALKVVDEACRHLEEYQKSKSAAGTYLSDQLLLPMAVAKGGVISSTEITMHTKTNIEIIRKFLNVEIKVEEEKENGYLIFVEKK